MSRYFYFGFSMFFFLLFLLSPFVAMSLDTVGISWIETYDGQAKDYDKIEGIEIDELGNVYVTGFITNTTRDYVTIKYDILGNLLWSSIYDGPDEQAEQPWGMAVDDQGNTYITGFSDSLDHGADFATVKYGPDGDELWVARYDGPAHWRDTGREVKVDSGGNVYVTGFSSRVVDPPGLDDVVTIKYDSDGSKIWVRRYGPDSDNEFASATQNIIDNDGNVISAGKMGLVDETGFHYEADILTIKYDPDGNELWSTIFDSESGLDGTRTLTVDNDDNVYVAGQDCGYVADECDFITIKYDPDGNEKWVRHYGVGGDADDKVYSIALDPDRNVYVTGPSNWNFYATVKYDTDGNEKWVRLLESYYPGFTCAYDISVDLNGNSYVTGIYQVERWDYGNADIATVKYDTDGNEKWVKRYFINEHSWEEGRFITHDDQGNIYVAAVGAVFEEAFNLITIKYSPCEGCHVEMDSFCDGETNPLNPCQICDMAQTETAWSDNDGVPCDDGLFCTGTGTCSGGECTDFSGDPCAPGETCDEEADECVPAGDDDDDDDDNDDASDDDDEEPFRLDESGGNGCCCG